MEFSFSILLILVLDINFYLCQNCFNSTYVYVTVVTSESEAISVEAPESGVSNGQHVTFPNHFQVPETLRNGLTFGSFDANFQLKGDSVNVGADITGAAESSQDSGEPSNEPSTRLVNSMLATCLNGSMCICCYL